MRHSERSTPLINWEIERGKRGVGLDSSGMCEVVRFRRCSWRVLCTRLLLDCGILFEKARYIEVVRITFERGA